MRIPLGFFTVVMLGVAPGAVVANPQPEAAARDCAAISEDAQRLACYDGLFRSDGTRDPHVNATPPVATAAVPATSEGATRPASAPAAASPVADFGLTEQQKEARQPREQKREPLDAMTARVTVAEQDRYGAWRLTLDNGQVWLQTEPGLGIRFQAGSTVEIRRASLGSFVLEVPGRPVIRVRRVR